MKIEGLYDEPEESGRRSVGGTARRDGGDFGLAARDGRSDGRLVITRLAGGVKDPNRVNVYVNERFALSLDVRQVVDLRVKVGRVLEPAELEELKAASEFGKLYQRALEWALTRPRSVRETRDYLKRRQLKRRQTNYKRAHEELKPLPEIQDAAAELVVERLVEKGYVDDRRFAEYYVENRFTKKGVSTKRLRLELGQKGIDEATIAAVLAESERSDESELMKMIAKKARKYDREKLTAYLMRQGFAYADVCVAIEAYEAETEHRTDK